MKILKLSPYHYPEKVSSSHLTADLLKAFADAGYLVENYVPMPSRGISKELREEYRNKKHEVQLDGHYIVHRFSMIREGRNPIQRALKYTLTNIVQYFKGSRVEGVDIIYGGSTPPTQGILCGMLKRKLSKKYGRPVPYVYCLSDVFPDSMVNSGMIREGGLIWKFGRKIENYTYNSADVIIVIGDGIKDNIVKKGVDEKKIVVIPNWIDTDSVRPVTRENNVLFDELKLSRELFYVTYAGNLGTAQGIDTIINAAEKLQSEPNIRFVIFGGGSKAEEYSQAISKLNNILLFPLQPMERVSEVYSMGDISIVACKAGVGFGAFPSKTFSIMATGTPAVISYDIDSDLWNLVAEKDCGYTAPADDSDALARQIIAAYSNREVLFRKGSNALQLVRERYSKKAGTSEYIRVLEAVHRANYD